MLIKKQYKTHYSEGSEIISFCTLTALEALRRSQCSWGTKVQKSGTVLC